MNQNQANRSRRINMGLMIAAPAVVLVATALIQTIRAEEAPRLQGVYVSQGQAAEAGPGIQRRSIADMRSVAISVLAYRVDHDAVPGPTSGYVTAEYLRSYVEPTYIRTLPVTDGWGNPILYRAEGKSFRVVSVGRDGQLDRSGAEVTERGFTEDYTGDVIWEDEAFLQAPRSVMVREAPQSWQQKETVNSIRRIATCCEAYAIDNDAYPGPTQGFVPVSELREKLEPIYIANLPANDHWGRPILYWSDGRDYRLISHGGDGRTDGDWDALEEGPAAEPGADIRYTNGKFIRWPEAAGR